MTFMKAFEKLFPCIKKRNGSKAEKAVVIIEDNSIEMVDLPASCTDVHKCSSLTCFACNKPGSVQFVKVDLPKKIVEDCNKATLSETSQASTAPSSPSPSTSQKTLTPPSAVSRQRILFENISSVGVIRAISCNADTTAKDKISVPYKLTRARSAESLDRFVESIESSGGAHDEDDVDGLIFGSPFKKQ